MRRYVHTAILVGPVTVETLGVAVVEGCLGAIDRVLEIPNDTNDPYWEDDPDFGRSLAALVSTVPIKDAEKVRKVWQRFFATAASVGQSSPVARATVHGPDRAVFQPGNGGFQNWKRAQRVSVSWIGYRMPEPFAFAGAPEWEHKAAELALIEDAWTWAAAQLSRKAVEEWARSYSEPDPNLQLERMAHALKGIG